MQLPKSVKIGGHVYEVVRPKDMFEQGECDLGQCDTKQLKIYVLDGIKPSQEMATLLHESIHAMNVSIDHALLDSLSEQMFQFLWDNKLLVAARESGMDALMPNGAAIISTEIGPKI